MAVYRCVEHSSEVKMQVEAVLGWLQTVGPCSHPTVLNEVSE